MSTERDILRRGDPWLEHYRGTRYHFNPEGEMWWRVPAAELKVMATAGHTEIMKDLLKVRPAGGSCRITETGAVITKDQENPDDPLDWTPLYVGEYVDPLKFEKVDIHGNGLAPFDLWPGFYDGARYSYKRGQLWWRNPVEAVWQKTYEKLPDKIEKRLLQVKPTGGTIRFTENGKVLTLIEPQPMPNHIEAQYGAMNNAQIRLIEVKYRGTRRLPIYLGDHHLHGFTLKPPERLTDPLSPDAEAEMVNFLKQYGDNIHGNESADLEFDDDRPEDLL